MSKELDTPKGLKAKVAMIGVKHQKQECILLSGGVPLVADGEDRVTKWRVVVDGNEEKRSRVMKRYSAQVWYHNHFSSVDYFNKVCIHPLAS